MLRSWSSGCETKQGNKQDSLMPSVVVKGGGGGGGWSLFCLLKIKFNERFQP